MGVSFFWLSLTIPPEQASSVAAHFAEAVTASPVSQSARRVLDRWREAPSSLSPELVPDPARPGTWAESEGAVDFEELFRPEALSAFGQGSSERALRRTTGASSPPRRMPALS
jgi:hypothetical protein